jgi:hypothetical protein
MVTCRGKYLGLHTTEKAVARACNVEAERVGRPLNVIPPARAVGTGAGAGPSAGAGPARAGACTAPKRAGAGADTKRTAPNSSAAPSPSKKLKLQAATSLGIQGGCKQRH